MPALFNSAPKMPAAPPVAPTMNNQAVQNAAQQQVAQVEQTSGRASTILSDNGKGNTLG